MTLPWVSISLASHCIIHHFSSCLPQILLFPDTAEFCVVVVLPLAPGSLFLLSRTTSHSLLFSLSSFPQCHSQVWGHAFCRCSTALGGLAYCSSTQKGSDQSRTEGFSLCPLITSWLNIFSDKNDRGIAHSASGMTAWGTYFHHSVSLPIPLLWLSPSIYWQTHPLQP